MLGVGGGKKRKDPWMCKEQWLFCVEEGVCTRSVLERFVQLWYSQFKG